MIPPIKPSDLIRLGICIIVAFCSLPAFVFGSDNLRFGTIEHVRSQSDARQRMVDFDIYYSKRTVSYEVRETPEGSLNPIVKSIEFRRDMELTAAETDSIFKKIIAAGLFELPQSAEHRGMGNIWSIFGSVSGHNFELSYRRPPQSGVRKRVDDAVSAIAHQFGLDQIGGPASATIVRKNRIQTLKLSEEQRRTNIPAIIETEGDRVPARSTTIAQLVRNASKFDRKRVSVVGFYHSEFEGYELRGREKSDAKENLWCDNISFFAPKNVDFEQDCWARVEGTFLKGPSGQGMWPGEITRVTRFDIQTQPAVATR